MFFSIDGKNNKLDLPPTPQADPRVARQKPMSVNTFHMSVNKFSLTTKDIRQPSDAAAVDRTHALRASECCSFVSPLVRLVM